MAGGVVGNSSYHYSLVMAWGVGKLTNMAGGVGAGMEVHHMQPSAGSLPYAEAGAIGGPTGLLPLCGRPAVLPTCQICHGINRRRAVYMRDGLLCQIQDTCS